MLEFNTYGEVIIEQDIESFERLIGPDLPEDYKKLLASARL